MKVIKKKTRYMTFGELKRLCKSICDDINLIEVSKSSGDKRNTYKRITRSRKKFKYIAIVTSSGLEFEILRSKKSRKEFDIKKRTSDDQTTYIIPIKSVTKCDKSPLKLTSSVSSMNLLVDMRYSGQVPNFKNQSVMALSHAIYVLDADRHKIAEVITE